MNPGGNEVFFFFGVLGTSSRFDNFKFVGI